MTNFDYLAHKIAEECCSNLYTPEHAAVQLTVHALDAWPLGEPITERDLRDMTTRHPNRTRQVS